MPTDGDILYIGQISLYVLLVIMLLAVARSRNIKTLPVHIPLWCLSWGAYALRYILLSFQVKYPSAPILESSSLIVSGISAILLIFSSLFTIKKDKALKWGLGLSALALISVITLDMFDFYRGSLQLIMFFMLAIARLVSGLALLFHALLKASEKKLSWGVSILALSLLYHGALKLVFLNTLAGILSPDIFSLFSLAVILGGMGILIIMIEDQQSQIMAQSAELKEINGRLSQSAEERGVMLREIHHRVLNNLQLISSLLSLQSRRSDLPLVDRSFKRAAERIAAIALIHRLLYEDADLARIEVEAFLSKLASYFNDVVNQCAVSIKLNAHELRLGVDLAIPVGLAASELISNALYHAFPDRFEGKVYISFKQTSDGYALCVEDDGVGLPARQPAGGLNAETEGLGLLLVDAVAAQLQGSLKSQNRDGGGALFELRFAAG